MEAEFNLPKSKTHYEFLLSKRQKVIMTHNDLDGISCKLVANMFLDTSGRYNFEQVYVNKWEHVYQNAKELEQFIKEYGIHKIGNNPFLMEEKDYLITDLNVSLQTAKWIDVLNRSKSGSKMWILDHHASGINLVKYPWCYIETQREWSATKLLYELYRSKIPFSQLATRYFTGEDKTLEIYVNAVNAYDTGDFSSEFGKLGVMFNRAFIELGWKKYASIMQNALFNSPSSGYEIFMEQDEDDSINVSIIPYEIEEAAEERKAKDEHRYQSMCKSSYTMENHNLGDPNYKIDVIIGASFGNDVNVHRYLIEHPEVDILATINLVGGTCSLRTNKEEINVASIASKFGGGGHKNAAAFTIIPEAISVKSDKCDFELKR